MTYLLTYYLKTLGLVNEQKVKIMMVKFQKQDTLATQHGVAPFSINMSATAM